MNPPFRTTAHKHRGCPYCSEMPREVPLGTVMSPKWQLRKSGVHRYRGKRPTSRGSETQPLLCLPELLPTPSQVGKKNTGQLVFFLNTHKKKKKKNRGELKQPFADLQLILCQTTPPHHLQQTHLPFRGRVGVGAPTRDRHAWTRRALLRAVTSPPKKPPFRNLKNDRFGARRPRGRWSPPTLTCACPVGGGSRLALGTYRVGFRRPYGLTPFAWQNPVWRYLCTIIVLLPKQYRTHRMIFACNTGCHSWVIHKWQLYIFKRNMDCFISEVCFPGGNTTIWSIFD